METSGIENYWQTYLGTLPAEQRPENTELPEAWGFGRGPEMADELGQLVVDGLKTATASLVWEYEAEGENIPKPGDLSIILNGRDEPICIIETTGIRILPFKEVDPQFAHDEGEGDRSLAYWREAHWMFFGETCRVIGREPAESMPVVCERFRVIYKSGK